MNVLSLFDGMSCGQIALNRTGIKYDNYFASEIDKHAIQVTQKNYPNTIQLGSVTEIKSENLPEIDLLIGGSPCQGFSFAGKQLNFDDSRSKLFFEFVRLLKETKPKYFLLENVKMKKGYQDVISKYLDVEPIEINSDKLSSQSRKRLYWTNIPNVKQPKENNITIKDILEIKKEGEKVIFNNGIFKTKAKNGKNIIIEDNYIPPFTIYETRTEEGKLERKRLYKLLGKDTTPRSSKYKEYRIRKINKFNCLLTTESPLDLVVDEDYNLRYLTISEMEKIQTIPLNYTNVNGVSNRQKRRMLGNGWTVDVIAHIFKNIKEVGNLKSIKYNNQSK